MLKELEELELIKNEYIELQYKRNYVTNCSMGYKTNAEYVPRQLHSSKENSFFIEEVKGQERNHLREHEQSNRNNKEISTTCFRIFGLTEAEIRQLQANKLYIHKRRESVLMQ